MTKKIVLYVIVLLLGLLIGAGTCYNHYRHIPAQVDTVYKYEKVPYTPLELKGNTYELETPQINVGKHVFIDVALLDTVYRDSIRYVVYPRQYYYTKVKDAEIWHSGVDSTIDSLVVFRENMVVSKTEITTRKTKRHGVSIGVEANYSTAPNFPVQLEYSYNVTPWMNVYGYAEYELLRGQVGIGIGTKLQISW